jgi:hypothetical protein
MWGVAGLSGRRVSSAGVQAATAIPNATGAHGALTWRLAYGSRDLDDVGFTQIGILFAAGPPHLSLRHQVDVVTTRAGLSVMRQRLFNTDVLTLTAHGFDFYDPDFNDRAQLARKTGNSAARLNSSGATTEDNRWRTS